MGKKSWAALLGIVALALALRVWRLDEVPPGFFRDEAAIGVDAHSVALTGKDTHGARLPVLFEALGDWKHPLYVYGAVASVRALGPTKLAVRLPAAVFGALTVLLVALLAHELTLDRRAALASALVLALTPWHVLYSRMAWEAVTLGFSTVLALWLYFRARRLGRAARFALAGAAFGLVFYSYTPAKLLVPAFFVAIVLIERADAKWIRFVADRVLKQAESAPAPPIPIQLEPPPVPTVRVVRRDLVWMAAACLVVAAPMIVVQATHFDEIQTRFRAVSVFREENPLVAIVASYGGHLSPRFLFVTGDANPRQGLPLAGFGALLLATSPFCAIGLWRALARREPEDLILVGWLAIYPMGAMLTNEGIPHASRAFLAVPLFAILAGKGFAAVLDRIEGGRLARAAVANIAWVLFVANAAWAMRFYFFTYPDLPSVVSAWECGMDEVVAELDAKRGKLAHVYFAWPDADDPKITLQHVLFFRRFDPRTLDPDRPDAFFQWAQGPNAQHVLGKDEEVVFLKFNSDPRRRDASGALVPLGKVIVAGSMRGSRR